MCISLRRFQISAIKIIFIITSIVNFQLRVLTEAETWTPSPATHMHIRSSRSLQTLAFHHYLPNQFGIRKSAERRPSQLLVTRKSWNTHVSPRDLLVGNQFYQRSSRPSLTSGLYASYSSSSASHPDIPGLHMEHFESLESTQDEVKKLLHDASRHEPNSYLAITTTAQTNGRGTNNRTWIGRKGNTFLTIALPSSDLKIPLTLLPLQIGNILAQQVQDMLKNTNASVKLKWPNDVLVDQKKIAGVLIESDQDHAGNYYFLVGIGVNYRFAPKVEKTGNERGRDTTCICDYLAVDDNQDDCGVEAARLLGRSIAKDVREWVDLQKNWDGAAENIVDKWESWAEFGNKLELRDEPGNQIVVPLSIEKDGRLRVKDRDNKERVLCVEYLL